MAERAEVSELDATAVAKMITTAVMLVEIWKCRNFRRMLNVK
jgi:hypothetical protein